MVRTRVEVESNDLARENAFLTGRIAAKLYQTYGWVGLDDLHSYAYLGLALAAKNFNPDRGVPFPYYAVQKAAYLAVDEMRKDGVLSRRKKQSVKFTASELLPEVLDPQAQDVFHDVEKRDTCRMLLGKCNSADRQLLIMYYAQGMTFKEIAEVLEISESAVCLRHKSLLDKLRKTVKCRQAGC